MPIYRLWVYLVEQFAGIGFAPSWQSPFVTFRALAKIHRNRAQVCVRNLNVSQIPLVSRVDGTCNLAFEASKCEQNNLNGWHSYFCTRRRWYKYANE